MTQYADLLADLGAQNAEDLSFMTAPELAPMPIIHAKRLIRRAAEAVAEAATYDQVRVERERRDADRAAEPNLSTHRATGPRKFDMDGPA